MANLKKLQNNSKTEKERLDALREKRSAVMLELVESMRNQPYSLEQMKEQAARFRKAAENRLYVHKKGVGSHKD